MTRKIIDMHQHLFAGEADAMAEEYHRLGVEKAVLLGHPPRRRPGNNEAILAAARRYPELYIPFVGFDLDEMVEGDLVRFQEQGFIGVKFIAPAKPYNHPAYFPIYARACGLHMPTVFHTGLIANKAPWTDCDSNLMRPIYLDHVARRLPELCIIGAHLGNPWYEEAAMACRWNPNLFFDLSGSSLKCKRPEFFAELLWWSSTTAYGSPDRSSAWQKIVFGSDVRHGQVQDAIRDYERLMDALDLGENVHESIWNSAAAHILKGRAGTA